MKRLYYGGAVCVSDARTFGGGISVASKLAPTRGNLVKLTKDMAMAQSGHDLLDQKRQVLMMELVRYIDSAKKIQEDVAKIFQDAYDALQKANVSLGIDTVGDISESIPITTDITVRLHSIMGVEIPDIDPLNGEAIPSYSFHGSSGAMDAAYAKFRRVMVLLERLPPRGADTQDAPPRQRAREGRHTEGHGGDTFHHGRARRKRPRGLHENEARAEKDKGLASRSSKEGVLQ